MMVELSIKRHIFLTCYVSHYLNWHKFLKYDLPTSKKNNKDFKKKKKKTIKIFLIIKIKCLYDSKSIDSKSISSPRVTLVL